MPKTKTSAVWKYFELDSVKKETTCTYFDSKTNKQCKAVLAFNNNTSSMRSHLKKHSINLQDPDQDQDQANSGTVNIKKALLNAVPYDKESEKYQNLLNVTTNFIIKTGQPLSIIDNKAFIHMIAELNNKFKLPSRQQLSYEIIPANFKKFKENSSSKLRSAKFCSFTTDCWSSLSNHSYMGVTLHFVNSDFRLDSIQVALKYIPESHTSLYLKEQIELVLDEFEVTEKIVAGCSDTARNIQNTINNLMTDVMYVPCFCHVLNLVVKDAIGDDKAETRISNIIKKCRKLVGCFKHSNKLVEQLKNYFLTNKKPIIHLKQDVVTRWNSTYLMIKSILNSYDAVRVVLNDYREHRCLLLKDDEIELLEELMIILELFYEFTENLSGSKYVTCSIIIPTFFLLRKCLSSFGLNVVNQEIKTIIESLKNSLTERATCYLDKLEILAATFLDPRFRNFRFIYEIKERAAYLNKVTKYLIDQAKSLAKSQSIIEEKPKSTNNASSQNSLRKFRYLDLEDDTGVDRNLDINDEISNYSNMNIRVDEDSCPLKFYESNSKQFPILSLICKKLFCITASSVPCEQLFSKAGEIITEKETDYLPVLLNALFFWIKIRIKF